MGEEQCKTLSKNDGIIKIALFVDNISFMFVNILTIWIFISIALSLFKTQASIVTPCSVKQNGA